MSWKKQTFQFCGKKNVWMKKNSCGQPLRVSSIGERTMGTNVKYEVKGKVLTITVDLAKDFGPSKSGKSTIIATTGGNTAIEGGVFFGLNVYKKA